MFTGLAGQLSKTEEPFTPIPSPTSPAAVFAEGKPRILTSGKGTSESDSVHVNWSVIGKILPVVIQSGSPFGSVPISTSG